MKSKLGFISKSSILVVLIAALSILLVGKPIYQSNEKAQFAAFETLPAVNLLLDFDNTSRFRKIVKLSVYVEGGGLTEEVSYAIPAYSKYAVAVSNLKSVRSYVRGKFIFKVSGLDSEIKANFREEFRNSFAKRTSPLSPPLRSSSHYSVSDNLYLDRLHNYGVQIVNLDDSSNKVFKLEILNSDGKVIGTQYDLSVRASSFRVFPLNKNALSKNLILRVSAQNEVNDVSYTASLNKLPLKEQDRKFQIDSYFVEETPSKQDDLAGEGEGSSHYDPQTIVVGTKFSMTFSGTYGSTSLSFSATPLPSGATMSNNTFSWTPAFNQIGTYDINIIGSDGKGFQTQKILPIKVIAQANRNPSIANVGDKTLLVGQQFQLTFNSTDPDGDVLTHSYSPAITGASFSGNIFKWTPTANQVGNYNITFVVSDGRGGSARTTSFFTVNQSPNRPPSIPSIGNRTLYTGTKYTFTFNGSDLDGDALTYSYSPAINGASMNGNTFTWTPAVNQIGTINVLFTVTDSKGASASTSSTFTVLNGGTPPNPRPWQNPRNQYDVNDNGNVEPIDVLMIINKINSGVPSLLTGFPNLAAGDGYYDVNGDGLLGPLDVLMVINYINSGGR